MYPSPSTGLRARIWTSPRRKKRAFFSFNRKLTTEKYFRFTVDNDVTCDTPAAPYMDNGFTADDPIVHNEPEFRKP